MNFENLRIQDIKAVIHYREKTKHWEAKKRQSHFIGVKLSGAAKHDFGYQSFVLSGNCIYFLNQKDDYTVDVLEPGEAFSVHFTTTEPVRTDSFCIPLGNTEELVGILDKLEHIRGVMPEGEVAALSLLYRLCAEFVRIREKVRFPGDRRMFVAKEYMDANFRDENCYAAALTASGLSDRRFRDLFQRQYDITPGRYLVLRKIEFAKELLQSGELAVGEVAALCGFGDVYYFSKCFKKETGVPPSRWNPNP